MSETNKLYLDPNPLKCLGSQNKDNKCYYGGKINCSQKNENQFHIRPLINYSRHRNDFQY